MGNAFKTNKAKSKPRVIKELDIEDDDPVYGVYQHQKRWLDIEDLIQEITTNSKWMHHETRYLLSQFRKLGQKKYATSLTKQQFTDFVPILLKSLMSNTKWKHFQTNKLYSKWIENVIKLFSISNEQITFRSFANTLSTACRGDNIEKAQLLFDIFDIDGDGTFNDNQTNLFLHYVLNINCIDNNISEGNDININKIIIKTQFIQYIEELVSSIKTQKSNKNDEDITNTEVMMNLSLMDLNNADDVTLLNTIKKLFIEKLYKKHNVKKIDFVAFASKSMNFEHLFASFMIITTPEDEQRIIKKLMNKRSEWSWFIPLIYGYFAINYGRYVPTGIIEICIKYCSNQHHTLDASWFVISKEWWDKWCIYTGYFEKDEKDEKRAMRPIKISNRSLLDEESYFTILKRSLQENIDFILLPKAVWQQLVKWYGGGPAIERSVTCTDKTIRMKFNRFKLQQMIHDEKSDSFDNNNNKDTNNRILNVTKNVDICNKERTVFLQQLSFSVHPDTLRIDLYSIHGNVVKINEKNKFSNDAISDFAISRCVTLPELYINLCASNGYQIWDIEKEKNNYKRYLQYKIDLKSNQRATLKNNKNDKDKDRKNDKDIPNIALPPRMWTVVKEGNTKILLYPIPKIKNSDHTNDDEVDEDEIDLQTIGLSSGVFIAIEFARPNKKKGGTLQYNLRCVQEDEVCQPDVDDSWLQFEEGDKIDARDSWGKWHEAQIKFHKKPKEPIPKKAPKLSKQQQKDIESLQKFEAIYVHYTPWEEKWDEWIFIDPKNTICNCHTECVTHKRVHRIAPPHSQSKYPLPQKQWNSNKIVSRDPEWGYSKGYISI